MADNEAGNDEEFDTPSDADLEAEAMSQPADDPELAAMANASDEPVDDDLLDRMRHAARMSFAFRADLNDTLSASCIASRRSAIDAP